MFDIKIVEAGTMKEIVYRENIKIDTLLKTVLLVLPNVYRNDVEIELAIRKHTGSTSG